ncbi:MAG: hypothetical protein IPO52_06710 [Gemmatimonadetes bacterium]|nr:hypothetical protein [Gemmatimonadota bacterium]
MLPRILAAGLILASTAPAPPAARAFPSYVLVRGGGITTPVLVHHRSARLRGLRGDVTYSPLATLLDLEDEMLQAPTQPATVVYEVAEYWMAPTDSMGRPPSPLKWEAATQYARIQVMPDGEVLWQSLPGGFHGTQVSYRRVQLPGIEVLAAAGVTFPPAVRRFAPQVAALTVAGCYTTTEARQFGGGAPGTGLPTRIVLETTPTSAANEWSLRVPQATGSARGSWHFGRADMVVLKLPDAMGGRRAHLLTSTRDTLRGMVETAASTPIDVVGDGLRMARTRCE